MKIIPADFYFWDKQQLFTVSEIGWLWCEMEPPQQGRMYWEHDGPPSGIPPEPPLSKSEIVIHQLLVANQDPSDALKTVQKHPDLIVGQMSFCRSDLRDWAERNGYKPLFLFPELRPLSQAGLSLNGALQMIAAMATALDRRWTPGRQAPHGMAKKIVEAAGVLGLQLNRNSVGKYLRESGNKKTSA